MIKQNKELIDELFNLKGYGWEELEELSEDIKKWINKDKIRYYDRQLK
jgi:hypothetical protein